MAIYDVHESITAGFSAPAEESSRYSVDLERYLLEHPISSILVSVKGDSMIDAGISPGDIVVVDKAKTPREDDIVIANIDHNYTLKYFKTDSQGKIYLKAANTNYMNIYPEQELNVFGVVVSLIRKY